MTDELREGVFSFYRKFYSSFWKDPRVRQRVLDYNVSTPPFKIYHLNDQRKLFTRILDHYLEEVVHIIKLITPFGLSKKNVILEIGGGLGLVYGYLKHHGYRIYSVEPSLAGFNDFFTAGQALFKIIGVDNRGWQPYKGAEVNKFKRRFDLIFSNNVLEHVDDLNGSFSVFKKVLKPKGLMVHNSANYLLPYDPHYKIFLFPFLERLTQLFRPELKPSTLWQDLNFSNAFVIYRLARKNGLAVKFLPHQLVAAIERLASDQEFSYRHRKMKKHLLFLRLLTKLPPFLQTPMAVVLKHQT